MIVKFAGKISHVQKFKNGVALNGFLISTIGKKKLFFKSKIGIGARKGDFVVFEVITDKKGEFANIVSLADSKV